jgi:molybdopterin/thiamine biosynthesis adenylyltransferase
MNMPLTDNELLRHARHLLLPTWDEAQQQRIMQGRVLVIGAGGLGCPVLQLLAGAGVGSRLEGHITLVDDDTIDLSNLPRQLLYHTADVGRHKVTVAAERIQQLNPAVRLITHIARADAAYLAEWVAQHDVVVDCSDNFATRYAINAACVASRTPLVSGAAVALRGQFAVYDLRQTDAPCYACVFPEQQDAPNADNCATTGIFSPLVHLIGGLQAAATLQLLRDSSPSSQIYPLQLWSGTTLQAKRLKIQRDVACPVCIR